MRGRVAASIIAAFALLGALAPAAGTTSPGSMTTIAGSGAFGFAGDGGPAVDAELTYVTDIAVNAAGAIFITDHDNQRVRRIGTDGIITTVAGNGSYGFCGDGGPALNACFRFLQGIAIDSAGNLYVSDAGNSRVRRIDAATGIISTFAGNGVSAHCGDNGPATVACLNSPEGLAFDAAGNLFIADTFNCRVRKVIPGGTITTVAGTGLCAFNGDGLPATLAYLGYPSDVVVGPGGALYIADELNDRVRLVSGGIMTTFAGKGGGGYCGDGGLPANACLNDPSGVAIDASGSLYIADTMNHRIRFVSGGVINTIAGNGIAGFCGDGDPAVNACLKQPARAALDSSGNLLIADAHNFRVRSVACATASAGDPDCDGVPSTTDNCDFIANATQLDTDGDAEGDACDSDDDNDGYPDVIEIAEGTDPLAGGSTPDPDADGVLNSIDNCDLIPNPSQTDTDADGQGNPCDPDDDNDGYADVIEMAEGSNPLDPLSTPDPDADGLPNTLDNCDDVSNPSQLNTDGDAQGDACDPDDDGDGYPDTLELAEGSEPLNALSIPDPDVDGVLNSLDNCDSVANPDQADADADALGNACDADDDDDGYDDAIEFTEGTDPLDPASTPDPDLDGVLSSADNCDRAANPDQRDTDDDALGDACDTDDDDDGCGDTAELGPDRRLGGERDPLNFWDWFDVTGDGSIELSDTLDVLAFFGDEGASGTPGDLRDRFTPDPLAPWRSAEANDGVDITDVLVSLDSFGHSCV